MANLVSMALSGAAVRVTNWRRQGVTSGRSNARRTTLKWAACDETYRKVADQHADLKTSMADGKLALDGRVAVKYVGVGLDAGARLIRAVDSWVAYNTKPKQE